MKKFLLTMLAIASLFVASCSPVAARTLATMPNQAGGEIRLTNVPCPNEPDQLIAYSIGAGGAVITGCYILTEDDEVMVSYTTGDLRIYKGRDFTVKEFKKVPAKPTSKPSYKTM